MTHYNLSSIFAWNMFLYTGFIVVAVTYLWTLMERRMNRYTHPVGLLAFVWRLVLTTGTGSIFGFLVARQTYDAAVMAPLFVVMSFSFGLAVFILTLLASFAWTGRTLDATLLARLKNLQGVFVAAVLYFVLVFHITNLYAAADQGVERFILLEGGRYTVVFWAGHILLGCVIPLLLFYWPRTAQSRTWIVVGAALVVLGGIAQLYVIVIGGQAYPLEMFPGKEVLASSFYDGVVTTYTPSLPELLLGIGGIALALVIVTLALRILRFLPNALPAGEAKSPLARAKVAV